MARRLQPSSPPRPMSMSLITKRQSTAIMLAVGRGNLAITKRLITAGADVNATDKDGTHALNDRGTMGRGQIAIVKPLLIAGANPEMLFDMPMARPRFKLLWAEDNNKCAIVNSAETG